MSSGPESAGAMAGMDMSGDGTVQLSADQLKQFGVTYATVDDRVLSTSLRTVGIITAAEDRFTQVTTKYSGYVEKLFVARTGEEVVEGATLAAVYSPALVAAQEELLIAHRLAIATGDSVNPGIPVRSTALLDAARRRLRLLDIPDAKIDSIIASGSSARTITFHAPVAGVVLEKNVVLGQAIAAGDPLYTIANLDAVWIEADLRESQIASVRPGTIAELEVPAVSGRWSGRVAFIYPVTDPLSRTTKARIIVPNPSHNLKPGMYATVSLTTPGRRTLAVPSSALIQTGVQTIVFVQLSNGRLAPTTVETGMQGDDYTEVLSGLEPGQRVVTSAQFLLDSESNLAEVMKSMIGQMGASDMGSAPAMRAPDTAGGKAKGGDMSGMKMPPSNSGGR
jgi:multidrug efflux pump subunit AcrA (membrane-fusion protein)